ncbi:hypothetical protein [Mixta intestinalis]|jgi:hypothetical protein|uniref:hypothetical protein n=1 Tax=Mixta intestinalis TaxID=1615494 RepID=UPI00136CB146|nr:hypothetical protein [Mixta intestinalis]
MDQAGKNFQQHQAADEKKDQHDNKFFLAIHFACALSGYFSAVSLAVVALTAGQYCG